MIGTDRVTAKERIYVQSNTAAEAAMADLLHDDAQREARGGNPDSNAAARRELKIEKLRTLEARVQADRAAWLKARKEAEEAAALAARNARIAARPVDGAPREVDAAREAALLAVYRVRNDGVLKGLKRWPTALGER